MLKIHVTLHLMLEVRNKDYVNCITYLRTYVYIYVGVLCINLSLPTSIDHFSK